MGSSKQQTSISRVMNILQEWDRGTKQVRKKILEEFIFQNQNKTGPELEEEFVQAASLFLTRLTAWLRLTYMTGICLNELLRAVTIFLSASSGHKFMAEFMEVGGTLTLLEIIGLKQAKDTDKTEALKCLSCIANAGRKYKELICESYGIRSVAECLAKSKLEDTQDACRNVLLLLAQGNPKFQNQVYKAFIALLPCSSPKAQQMACNSLRVVQKIVGSSNPSIVDPLLNLLKTLHLEVQFEAIELIKDLMEYEVADSILSGLVGLLKPSMKDAITRYNPDEVDALQPPISAPLHIFVQQAAAAKTICILAKVNDSVAEQLVQIGVIHSLMYAMGNTEHADSQRQASLSLKYFCQLLPVIDDCVKDAMGDALFDLFMANPDTLYLNMTHVQADVLVSNKISIPKCHIYNDVIDVKQKPKGPDSFENIGLMPRDGVILYNGGDNRAGAGRRVADYQDTGHDYDHSDRILLSAGHHLTLILIRCRFPTPIRLPLKADDQERCKKYGASKRTKSQRGLEDVQQVLNDKFIASV
ncbi:Armadillo-like helical domain containing protein 1 [Bulinus truncatus]|nr:Armadillo-like helical domain containing protein 1 [Bulinus truncatus]